MNIILFMGIFWSIYGLLGLFGVQVIPQKFKGKSWTKKYIRSCGLSWVLLGIPWLVAYLIIRNMDINYYIVAAILIATAVPSVIYSAAYSRKYKTMLKNGQE